MEFLKERVFTALNADELKAGDKVIVADTLEGLKYKVKANEGIDDLYGVADEGEEKRFLIRIDVVNLASAATSWLLAYLMERAENCTNCGKTDCDARNTRTLEANKVFRGCCWQPKTTENNCKNCKEKGKWETCKYEPPDCQFYEPIKKVRPFRDTDELIKVWLDKGSKWQKRELTMPLIWVRRKDCNCKGQLITKFSDPSWVIMSTEGYNMTDLFVHFTFLDGSPCGVEE